MVRRVFLNRIDERLLFSAVVFILGTIVLFLVTLFKILIVAPYLSNPQLRFPSLNVFDDP